MYFKRFSLLKLVFFTTLLNNTDAKDIIVKASVKTPKLYIRYSLPPRVANYTIINQPLEKNSMHKRSLAKQKLRNQNYKDFLHYKKETDTIRGTIREYQERDQNNGEIAYSSTTKKRVQEALTNLPFNIEREITLSRHVKTRVEKEWHHVDLTLAERILSQYEDGEVLNRSIVPCWWR